MPSTYRVTTDQGVFDVTVDDGAGQQQAQPSAHVERPSNAGALPVVAAGQMLPKAAELAAEFGTNPNVPQAAATVGRVIGGLTSLPAGLTGLGDVHKGVWAGGRSGWFTGKLAQDVARPMSSMLEKAAPIVNAAGIVQGALDLHQMAEPNRRDIGFLGIGPTVEPDVAMLTAAVKKGANPTQAAAQLTNGDPRKFAALITAYSQSLGQGR